MSNHLKIVFFGTPEFATHILDGIVASKHEVVGVVTVADKPAGRGRKLNESHVKQYAVKNDLNVLQPTNLKADDFIENLQALDADLFVVVAFRMLPKRVWDMPDKGTFNLHASLLPQYRGAAPINWAVINQEEKSGVTTFFIDDQIDTGAVIAQKECEINPDETAGSLYERLKALGRELTSETIEEVAKGNINTISQKHSNELKSAPKLNLENTTIDFNQTAEEVDAHVRGLFPFPVAKAFLINGVKLQVKIFQTKIVNNAHKMQPGAIVVKNSEIWVACSQGFIILEKIQLPNKKAMLAKDLLNGFQFDSEARFDVASA
ncbi:MAG: methionyl-tRNA formyltransferase [Nonlabens sp.]